MSAVVLAAGEGARFSGPTPKLLAPFRGRPMVVWAVEAALAAALDQTLVVTGDVDVAAALAEAGLLERVTLGHGGNLLREDFLASSSLQVADLASRPACGS